MKFAIYKEWTNHVVASRRILQWILINNGDQLKEEDIDRNTWSRRLKLINKPVPSITKAKGHSQTGIGPENKVGIVIIPAEAVDKPNPNLSWNNIHPHAE
jgi:hypothetical protein